MILPALNNNDNNLVLPRVLLQQAVAGARPKGLDDSERLGGNRLLLNRCGFQKEESMFTCCSFRTETVPGESKSLLIEGEATFDLEQELYRAILDLLKSSGSLELRCGSMGLGWKVAHGFEQSDITV